MCPCLRLCVSRCRKGLAEGSKIKAGVPGDLREPLPSSTAQLILNNLHEFQCKPPSLLCPSLVFSLAAPVRRGWGSLEALSRAGPEGPGSGPVAWEWSPGDAGHPYLLPG